MQVDPQLMPAGVDVTVPAPVPPLLTVSGYCKRVNMAVTCVGALTPIMQGAVPEQPPPDQPANADPAAGDADSVTVLL